MHCPEHTKYQGNIEIQRLAKCAGCRKVRQAYLAGTQARKNKGKGGQFSITTPGFRCGVGHLLAELGTVILYGSQPPFFWRVGVRSDPRAKEHYKKIYSYLIKVLIADQDLYNQVKGLLWKIWEVDYHKIQREKEHKLSLGEAQKATVTEEKVTKEEFMSNVHINPLLYPEIQNGESINGQEEEGKRDN